MLRARIEEGLSSALFLLRTDLPAAAEHARAAVRLAEEAGDRHIEIAALSVLGLVDAVTGGSDWRQALELGMQLEERTGPVQAAISATFPLAVVLTWVDQFAQAIRHIHMLIVFDLRVDVARATRHLDRHGFLVRVRRRRSRARRARPGALRRPQAQDDGHPARGRVAAHLRHRVPVRGR